MNVTAIVSIGFGDSSTRPALDRDESAEFAALTKVAIQKARGEIVSQISGPSYSEEWGTENGIWYVASIHPGDVHHLRSYLAPVKAKFGQDAIALTVGKTEFI